MKKVLQSVLLVVLMTSWIAGCSSNTGNTVPADKTQTAGPGTSSPGIDDSARDQTGEAVENTPLSEELPSSLELDWIPERSYSFPADEEITSISEDEAKERGAAAQKKEFDAGLAEDPFYCFYFTLTFNSPGGEFLLGNSIRIDSAVTNKTVYEWDAGFLRLGSEEDKSGELVYVVYLPLNELIGKYQTDDRIYFILNGKEIELSGIHFTMGLNAPIWTEEPIETPDNGSPDKETLQPVDTGTPAPTATPRPSDTPKPTPASTAPTPSPKASATPTPTPSPTPAAPQGAAIFKIVGEAQRYYTQIGGTNTHPCADTVDGIKSLLNENYKNLSILEWVYEKKTTAFLGKFHFKTLANINFEGDTFDDIMVVQWQVPTEIKPNLIVKTNVTGICTNAYYNEKSGKITKLYDQTFSSPSIRFDLYATKAKGTDAIISDYKDINEKLALGEMGDMTVSRLISNDYRNNGIPAPDGNKQQLVEVDFQFPEEVKNYQTLYFVVRICPSGMTVSPEMYYYYIYQR